MKKLLTSLFLLAIVLSSSAQMQKGLGFGAKVGLNMSDITSSSGGSRYGLSAGVFTDFYFTNLIGLELNAAYNQFGVQGNTIVPVDGIGKADWHFDYINLSLVPKFHFIDGFRVFFGPQVGFLVNSEVVAESYRRKIEDANKFQVDIVAGVGYTFNFGLDLQAQYTRGLSSAFTDLKYYNYAFTVTAGWRFIGKGGRAKGFKR